MIACRVLLQQDAAAIKKAVTKQKASKCPKHLEFGRIRLLKTFFMREFLFSDIAAIHGFNNVPDDPDLAIAAGRKLCEDLLEPLQDAFGRIAIRSAFRSVAVLFGSVSFRGRLAEAGLVDPRPPALFLALFLPKILGFQHHLA